jgi:GTPase SAR1 family protein
VAGGERFQQIAQSYYRGAHGVLVIFDLTNRSTFAHAPAYLEEKLRYGA